MNTAWLDKIRWTADGLVPAIAQDANTGKILMFAWMNKESLALTAQEGYAVYWSRSRNKLWRKGEESGHRQKLISIHLDCDEDVILLKIEQEGGIACHTGRESCFYRQLINGQWQTIDPVLKNPDEIMNNTLTQLAQALEQRKNQSADKSYVASLYAKGLDSILKKIGEEATETVIAAKNGDKEQIIYETADLWFHCMVMLAQQNLHPDDVLQELQRRFGLSGLEEKASRDQ